jgi:hypothetical protein
MILQKEKLPNLCNRVNKSLKKHTKNLWHKMAQCHCGPRKREKGIHEKIFEEIKAEYFLE